MDSLETWILEGRKSHRDEDTRYRYLVVLIVVIVVVFYLDKKNRDLHLDQIKTKELVIYIIVTVVLFYIFMKNAKNIKNTQWLMLHFAFYFGLGYFCPNNWPAIFIFMTLWEIFEDEMGYGQGKEDYIETDRKKMLDIGANGLGYLLGNAFFRNVKLGQTK